MREFDVAATIIHLPPDSYILHQRTEGIDSGEIGKLGLYGGQKEEKDKSHKHAAIRELGEESGVEIFTPKDLTRLGYVHTKSGRLWKKTITEAEIFLLPLNHGFDVEQFEFGRQMTEREISRAMALGHLTSVASKSFSKFYGL
jgi:8-oxo-dGTP pyrophosphatase MutT (NUDIX family)